MRPRKQKIRESFEELDELRRFYKGTVEEVKLTFLRLLKEDSGRPLADATRRLGITERRGRYWWETYCSNGLRGLLERRVWGREKLEKNVPKIEVQKAHTGTPAFLNEKEEITPGSFVDYPAFINAVASVAHLDDPIEWTRAISKILVQHIPEVDFAVLSIRANVDIVGETRREKQTVLRQGRNNLGETTESYETARKERPNFEELIESGTKRGFDFSRYHFPPTGFDFFLKKGRREEVKADMTTPFSICIGSLLLFRKKHLSPFSPNTLDLIERLRPYLTYVFTDFILRIRQDIPGMEQLNEAVTRITSEAQLSEREQDVLNLLLLGYTEKRIADALNISKKTVESHAYSIYRKTGVSKITELFARYQTPVGHTRTRPPAD